MTENADVTQATAVGGAADLPTLADVPRRDLATIVANDVPDEALDAFAQQLDLYRIPPTAIRLREIASVANRLADRLEQRWALDAGGIGWRDGPEGEIWTFRGTSSRKWTQLGDLFDGLLKRGLSLRTIAAAVSEIRVTDLREAAKLFGAEREKEIRDFLEEHRERHHGTPHFKKLEED